MGSRFLLLFVPAALLMACGGDTDSALTVERTDSAGIEVITTRGPDVPLDWRFEPALRIGSDEGEAAFGGVFSDGVAVTSDGRIAVLDAMSQRVVLFDRNGTPVASFGRKGGGPGEMQFPNALTVDDAGTFAVYDFSKRGALRFGPDGAVLPQQTLPPLEGTRLRTDSRYTWGVFVDRAEFGKPGTLRLLGVPVQGGDTVRLASWVEEGVKPVQFPNCQVGVTMPPLLAPRLHWGGGADRIVFGVSDAYRVSVWQNGRVVRVMQRDVQPETVTQEMAEREVGDTMRIRFGSGACAIPPRDVVTARGRADVMPAFRDIIVAPNGRVWVARGVGPRTEWHIDVFEPSGAYAGTLPAGTPVPAAFTAAGEVVTVERDELDRQYVVIYRIRERSGAA